MAVLGLASRTLDVAALFRLVLELAPAGTSWHAVADMGDTVRESAADQPSSSTHTREALGWKPTHPSLLEDLECIHPRQAARTTGASPRPGAGH
jgi:hypothetical protein